MICSVSLIVHPEFHDQGIGAKLMNEVESLFEDSRRYELFTGHLSKKNLYFYEKLGYRRFKSEKIHENLEMIYLEKYTHK